MFWIAAPPPKLPSRTETMIPPATQANFGLELGMVFRGTKEVYERIYVSIPNESDRNSNMRIRNRLI